AAGAEGRSLQTGGKRIELFYIVRLRYRDRNIAAAQAVPESVQQGRTDDTAPLPAGVWCAARCDNKTRVTAQIEARLPILRVVALRTELRGEAEARPRATAGGQILFGPRLIVVRDVEPHAQTMCAIGGHTAIFDRATWPAEAVVIEVILPPLRLEARLDHHFEEVRLKRPPLR